MTLPWLVEPFQTSCGMDFNKKIELCGDQREELEDAFARYLQAHYLVLFVHSMVFSNRHC